METILDSSQTEAKTFYYAGFWIRFIALLIDSIILNILQIPVSLLILGRVTMVGFRATGDIGEVLVSMMSYILVAFLIQWLYYASMESSVHQASLGKRAVGIKVCDINGERLSFAHATGRFFAKLLSSLTLGIGYLVAAFNPRKQALHDIVAGTLVVYKG